jgi:hypothetical protein
MNGTTTEVTMSKTGAERFTEACANRQVNDRNKHERIPFGTKVRILWARRTYQDVIGEVGIVTGHTDAGFQGQLHEVTTLTGLRTFGSMAADLEVTR